MFASVPLVWRLWQSRRKQARAFSLLNDESHMQCEVLEPGLVILRDALCMKSQLLLAERIFEHGHAQRKWWAREKVGGRPQSWVLNNHRQGRGRIYDALHSYPDQDELLRGVCLDSVVLARRLDPALPALLSPTHLLTLYYTSARKLGWHRDNGNRQSFHFKQRPI